MTLFKIARAETLQASLPVLGDGLDPETLGRLAAVESWTGDLGNGVIRLGERALALHGLDHSECGLLSMMRCYEPQDRAHIIELFEQAATTSCSFCFSTTIISGFGQRQPVFCIGESNGMEQRHSGSMSGVFIFPRFHLASSLVQA
jgi:hypothetical protein